MSEPYALTVLKALTSALEGITVDDGFNHDLTGKVFRGRMVLQADEKPPLIAIVEPPKAPEETEMPTGSSARSTMHSLLIQGFAQDDRDNPTDPAYWLLADVQKRLAQEKVRDDGYDMLGLGPRITAIHLGQPVVRPPDAVVSDTAFFWLPITLGYGVDLQNPFA